MPLYATPAQLSARLGGRAIPEPLATALLEEASALVDDWVGYPLTLQAGYVETFVGNGLDRLYLPRRFTSVDSVALGGTALAAGGWTFDQAAHSLRASVGVWYRGLAVTVAGSSGYAPGALPFAVRAVVLAAAGRAVDNPTGGVRSDNLGDHSITFSTPDAKGQGATTGGVFLTSTEQETLDLAGLRDWAFG